MRFFAGSASLAGRLDGLFTPNTGVTAHTGRVIATTYAIAAVAAWLLLPSKILPSPLDVLRAYPELWEQGLGYHLIVSLMLNVKAVAIMSFVSLTVAYLSTVPALAPVGRFVATFRFNGFVGLPLLLTLWIGDQHWIKVTLLVIGMSVFTVPSLMALIDSISSDQFDHARTLKMGEWRVLWEVVIRGRMADAIDILRTNVAIGWSLLPMVEGLFRSDGGIGVLILTENKMFRLDAIYAIIFLVLSVGVTQDVLIQTVKRALCPHAFMATERR